MNCSKQFQDVYQSKTCSIRRKEKEDEEWKPLERWRVRNFGRIRSWASITEDREKSFGVSEREEENRAGVLHAAPVCYAKTYCI